MTQAAQAGTFQLGDLGFHVVVTVGTQFAFEAGNDASPLAPLIYMLPYAASAGLTRFAISAPFSRSTTPMSYWPCKSSQNCAPLPK